MAEPRQNGQTATLLLDGTVLVVGGDHTRSAELYDPSSRRWTATASMLAASGGRATLLPDGRVLVVGRACGQEELEGPAYAEIYDSKGGFSDVEANLLSGLRPDARFACTARRDDLPAHAVAGVECSPEVDTGDSGPTIGPYRYGCYLNEFGNANYRFTAPDSLVYVGILGTGTDLAALHDWAWLGNQDVPGSPTVWREPVR